MFFHQDTTQIDLDEFLSHGIDLIVDFYFMPVLSKYSIIGDCLVNPLLVPIQFYIYIS